MVRCASCGQESPPSFRFCGACGAPLDQPAAAEQRKVVTLLFCDVTGSTALGERLDAEAVRRIMRRYFEEIEAVVERHGGTVEKFVGDAVMAVFGIPRVSEDDALRAVRAAAEIGRRLPELAAELGVALTFRTGINTGEVVVGQGQTLATGDAVNVAARLEQAAAPGEILIGVDTRRLVRDAVTCEPVAPLELKGKAEPTAAFRLLAVDASAPALARRPDAPLVGRERELRLLRQAYGRAVDESSCHLFTLLGMAGAGKSRLVDELIAGLGGAATVLRGRCLHYGDGVTFWPLTDALRPLGAPAQDVLDRIERGGGSAAEELFWDVRRLLEQVAAAQPLVLVLDDLQWAEPMFLDLLDHVTDLSRDVPILLLCVARPELLEERPGWGGGKLNATTVLLEPLAAAACHDLLDDLAGDLGGAARDRIARASGGNPLFLEEMVALVRDGGGSAIPATIRALLDARLERLGAEERAVIERGAVEGEVFHRAPVLALVPEPVAEDFQTRIAGLIRKEMIRPTQATLPDDDAFRFRHLLVRDATYDAVPKEARAELHQRFAAWLEEHAPTLAELDEIAGWHTEQAVRYRRELGLPVAPELAAHAADHLAAAGRRAADRHDVRAADALLTRALALVPDDHPAHAPVALALAEALLPAGEDDRVGPLLDAAEAAERTRARATVTRVLWQQQLDADEALRLSAAVLPGLRDEATRAGDHAVLALIHWAYFWEEWNGSRAARATAALAEARHYARLAGDHAQLGQVMGWGAAPVIFGPAPADEMREWIATTEAAGPSAMGRFGLEITRGTLATMEYRLDEAREHFAIGHGILRELGFTLLLSASGQMTSRVAVAAGDTGEAVSLLRASYDEGARLGDHSYHSTTAAMLAEALRQDGRLVEAEAMALEAETESSESDPINFAIARAARALVAAADGRLLEAEELAASAVEEGRRTDFVLAQAETLLAQGHVLRALGRASEADAAFAAAVALAEAKGDRPLTDRARAVAAGADA